MSLRGFQLKDIAIFSRDFHLHYWLWTRCV